jgi:hypothetical protein
VGGFQAADLLAALGQLGLDQDELSRAGGVDRQALKRPDGRIPRALFVAILARPSERLRDPFIGLHASLPHRLFHGVRFAQHPELGRTVLTAAVGVKDDPVDVSAARRDGHPQGVAHE